MKARTGIWLATLRVRLYAERMRWQALIRQDWQRWKYWQRKLDLLK